MADLIHKDVDTQIVEREDSYDYFVGNQYSKRTVYLEEDGHGGTFYHTTLHTFSVLAYDNDDDVVEDEVERARMVTSGERLTYGWESITRMVTHMDKDDIRKCILDYNYGELKGKVRYATEAEARYVAKTMCDNA